MEEPGSTEDSSPVEMSSGDTSPEKPGSTKDASPVETSRGTALAAVDDELPSHFVKLSIQ